MTGRKNLSRLVGVAQPHRRRCGRSALRTLLAGGPSHGPFPSPVTFLCTHPSRLPLQQAGSLSTRHPKAADTASLVTLSWPQKESRVAGDQVRRVRGRQVNPGVEIHVWTAGTRGRGKPRLSLAAEAAQVKLEARVCWNQPRHFPGTPVRTAAETTEMKRPL